TLYGYRRRRSNAHRVWVSLLALASLIVVPRIMDSIATLLRPPNLRDSSLSRQSQSAQPSKQESLFPETSILPISARADANVVEPAVLLADSAEPMAPDSLVASPSGGRI